MLIIISQYGIHRFTNSQLYHYCVAQFHLLYVKFQIMVILSAKGGSDLTDNLLDHGSDFVRYP